LNVMQEPDGGPCFWKEARPALVFAIQQGWLMGETHGLDVEEDLHMTYRSDSTCVSVDDYFQSLLKEANQGSMREGAYTFSPADVMYFKFDQGFMDHFRLFVADFHHYMQVHREVSWMPNTDDSAMVQRLDQNPATHQLFAEAGITAHDVAVGTRSIMYGNARTANTGQACTLEPRFAAIADAATKEWFRNDYCPHRNELNDLLRIWMWPTMEWPTGTLGPEPESK